MLFKHPEILYALFLLVIPILIHLFQLRKFQKESFTNVKFLKFVKLQTRKSSQLKKWLTLITRMLLLAATIMAFAQPYIPKTKDYNPSQDTVIYLDNSFSMQAKGKNGTLLNELIQDIINSVPENETISVFTNTDTYKNTTLKAIKNKLIKLEFSQKQLNYDAVYLKGKQLLTSQKGTKKNLILASDFQQKKAPLNFKTDSLIDLYLVQPKANTIPNISIDSVYISKSNAENLELNVRVTSDSPSKNNVAVSLYNKAALLSKTSISPNTNTEATFTLATNTIIDGKLVIEDNGLQYDNSFYFNINEKPKIKILAINNNADDTFLKRIYTDDEFQFNTYKVNSLNFNLIKDQNLIILNELETITNALYTALAAFMADGGHVLVIPSKTIDTTTYNTFFKTFTNIEYTTYIPENKQITTINYNHPVFENVFYTKVTNFKYPKVESAYKLSSKANSILNYEDGSAFLMGTNNHYIFTSAISAENSNFKNSQLIVPVFYNIGLQSLKLSKLYYTIGQPNSIAIKTSIGNDDILELQNKNTTETIIPLQRTYSKYVTLETEELPNTEGIFEVKNKTVTLQNLSFNYDRTESTLSYYNLETVTATAVKDNLAITINEIKSNATINALWKWFLIFALVFLLSELLILKYLK